MSIGQFSLRSLAGYLTVVCLCLSLLRRPLELLIETIILFDEWSFAINVFFMPWYLDFYLVGFEDYWPFSLTPFSTENVKPHIITVIFSMSGILIYLLFHLTGLIFVCSLLRDIFWPQRIITDEEAEELLSEEEEEDIPVGEEIIEDEEKE